MSEIIVTVVPVFSSLGNLAFALRRAVAVVEQGVPEAEEFDDYDLTAAHGSQSETARSAARFA